MATYSRRKDDESGEPIEGVSPAPDPRDDVDPLQLPEEEQLVYDLSAWPIDVQAEVAADAVLDAVEESLEADGLSVAEEPGESPLSALFVAVDDLATHPNDRDAILRLNDLLERTEEGPVPFGLNPASWDRLLDEVSDLLDLSLEAEDSGEVKAEAIELREALRPLV